MGASGIVLGGPLTAEGASLTPTATACPFVARAWWGDVLLAESADAVRLEPPSEPPMLAFPLAQVHTEHLVPDPEPTRAVGWLGPARSWSTGPGLGPVLHLGRAWGRPQAGTDDGRGILKVADASSPLAGRAVFDHERVRVELVDAAPGDDPRDVTTKRFPTWGDATDLIDLLRVDADGPDAFVGVAFPRWGRQVVEGSQLLGQALVAAARRRPERRPVSASMLFLRPVHTDRPIRFRLEPLSDGRTFTALRVHVDQEGRERAVGQMLLDVTAPDVVRHQVDAPHVPGPYESEPCDMAVTGRDIRVVDGAYGDDPDAPAGPPVIDTWVRFRRVPDDPALHVGLLAQFTGHMAIAAALRPHFGVSQLEAHRTLSTAVNAIDLALHADVRADDWMLYHHHATFAGDGMTRAACRVHDREGRLVASFSVTAMVRRFPAGAVDDDRRAL